MSVDQRQQKISRFMKATVENDSEHNRASDNSLDVLKLQENQCGKRLKTSQWMKHLSLRLQETKVPIWLKVIVTSNLIMSKCHNVVVFLCDDQYLSYKSMKICSHVVALAIKEKCLSNLLKWYCTSKFTPNFTTLAESGKPSTAGKSQCERGLLRSMQDKSKV